MTEHLLALTFAVAFVVILLTLAGLVLSAALQSNSWIGALAGAVLAGLIAIAAGILMNAAWLIWAGRVV